MGRAESLIPVMPCVFERVPIRLVAVSGQSYGLFPSGVVYQECFSGAWRGFDGLPASRTSIQSQAGRRSALGVGRCRVHVL